MGRSVLDVLRGVGLYVVWQLPVLIALQSEPWVVLVVMALTAWGVVQTYASPRYAPARRRAWSRVRPVGPGAPWVLRLVPVIVAIPVSLGVALMALGVMPDEPLDPVFEELLQRPWGGVAMLALIVGLAPLTEELAFRGWIQGALERRYGAAAAIAVSSALFALAHFTPDALPIHFTGGLVLGFAVHATRSVWAGVWLHAAWNAGVIVVGAAIPDPVGAGWRMAGPALAVFAVAAAAALVGCRALWRAARGPGARARRVPGERGVAPEG